MKCKECKVEIDFNYVDEVKKQLQARHLCYECNFWLNWCLRKNDPRIARIAGEQYIVGDEDDPSKFRGFDGAKFIIVWFDGRSETTTNLWYNGQIPTRFLKRMPDNAKFGF